MMMGNALFNTGGQPQMLSGYMDPFAMTDMQDAMGEYAQPNSK